MSDSGTDSDEGVEVERSELAEVKRGGFPVMSVEEVDKMLSTHRVHLTDAMVQRFFNISPSELNNTWYPPMYRALRRMSPVFARGTRETVPWWDAGGEVKTMNLMRKPGGPIAEILYRVPGLQRPVLVYPKIEWTDGDEQLPGCTPSQLTHIVDKLVKKIAKRMRETEALQKLSTQARYTPKHYVAAPEDDLLPDRSPKKTALGAKKINKNATLFIVPVAWEAEWRCGKSAREALIEDSDCDVWSISFRLLVSKEVRARMGAMPYNIEDLQLRLLQEQIDTLTTDEEYQLGYRLNAKSAFLRVERDSDLIALAKTWEAEQTLKEAEFTLFIAGDLKKDSL